jgi:type I restriction enzyme, S subunit
MPKRKHHRAPSAAYTALPEGWFEGMLSDAVSTVRGGFSVNCEDRQASASEKAVLKAGAVLNGRFDAGQHKFVPEDQHGALRTPVSKGTIIFCRKNSEETIGASALVERDVPNTFLSDLLWELQPSKTVEPYWLLSVLQSGRFRKMVRLEATGTQSTMKNISQDRLLRIGVAIPPLNEQRKIAEILRTWDEAIEKLGALRAAKERRLNALASRFFEPCHPSFHERPASWRECELGDVFRERNESGTNGEDLLSITMSEGVINREDVGRKDTSNEDKSRYKLILPGDIGYNTMRMWQGVSGLSVLRGIVSPAYTIVTADSQKISPRYAAHLFKSRRMVFDFQRYSQGLTSDTWNLKFPAFSKIRVYLPPIETQEKQADLLDTMCAELGILKRECDALERQKRGLMQKLLTGKWRVDVHLKEKEVG